MGGVGRLRRLAITAAILAIAAVATDAMAELRHDLHNPFRFFRHPSDYAIHRIAFDLILLESGNPDRSKITVDQVEVRLARPDFWTRPITAGERQQLAWPSSWSGDTPLQIAEKLRKDEKRQSIASLSGLAQSSLDVVVQFGWATLLDSNLDSSKTGTCWNRIERRHNNCPDYLAPKSWRARVFDDSNPSGDCSWQIQGGAIFPGGGTGPVVRPCREITIDIVASTVTGASPSGQANVTRQDSGGAQTALAIKVSDDLVLGLGDSYSSGEGNPDRPVVFSPNLIQTGANLPRRPDDNPKWAAQWIDRSCHRSAYAWQLRSALHQTLIDPRRAVTFLGLACSGAEIVEGLLFPWPGTEPTAKKSAYRSQLGAIYEELCTKPTTVSPGPIPLEELDGFLDDLSGPDDFPWANAESALAKRIAKNLRCSSGSFTRPIDAIFLGIGGNDVGFAKWIAGAILEGSARDIAGGFIPRLTQCSDDQDACDLTAARLARLKSRYAVLRRILEDRVIKDAQISPSKILVAAYPKALTASDGTTPCPEGNGGMTVSVWPGLFSKAFAIRDNSELKSIEKFRSDHLVSMLKQFSTGDEPRFTFVDGFVDEFKTHGFCATNEESEANGKDYGQSDLFNIPVLNASRSLETLHMPRLGAPKSKGGIVIDPEVWRPFRPTQWRPYALRSRWFRTPNDAFMTVNNKPSGLPEGALFGILDLRDRASSGSFHPTARAHAKVATSMAPALAKALEKQ